MLRIVHISDFHLRNSDLFSTEEQIVQPLISDLEEFNTDRKINFIVCSGDLINKGGSDFDDIDIAFDTFKNTIAEKILSEFNLSPRNLILTCGNHDIDRNLDSTFIEKGLLSSLDNPEDLNDFVSKEEEEGSKRIEPYNNFVKNFYKQFLGDEISFNRFTQVHKFYEGDVNVGFASINSSWRCYDSELDVGKLLIAEEQINFALKELKGCNIKIAVIHHPLSHLASFNRDVINPVLYREFDLLLMGHNHQAKSETTHSLSHGLFFSHAPGVMNFNINNESRKYSNGYRVIDFDPFKSEVTSYSRRYNKNDNRFDPNTDDGDKRGECNYKLPSNTELAKIQKKEDIANTIQDINTDKFNSQLLSYNTDSVAPKKLKDLFVDPELIYREKGKEENNYDQIKFTIDDLLTSDKNFLIAGIKESGKTCLLNKIVDEATEDIFFYNYIPIKINFETLNSRRIESEINDFTNIGMSDVKRLKKEQDILLLIDNIKFDEANKVALKKLNNFLVENPSARIISTSNVANQEEIPLDLLKYNEEFKFKFLSLKGFKVQQIRTLVKKWFKNSESIDTPEKVDSVVKLFKSLSLPRTPLAISILLWIIEKQEDYKPTNESTMLENFIERIFKKHSKSEVYSAKFDHSNKTRILSSLAVRMLESDNENYSLKYSLCLIFFEKYLDERLFTFEAQKILDYFIEIGVLIKDNGYVRFRFQCFFEYFLMKQMGYDDDFKIKVLEEDHYLQFTNEIKYYSGIKRDQVDILEILLTRLEREFEPIEKELYSNVDSIDDYFQMSESLLDQIDESTFLNEMEANKPTEEDLDQMNDQQLDLNNPDTGIKKKELPTNIISKLGNILNLAALVLKNSEEITKDGLKQKAYENILKAEVLYTVLYQFELKRFLEDNSENLPFDLQSALGFLVNYTPTILQLSLYSNIGTDKLSYVFEKQIEECFNDDEASDLERFFSVFIYSENRGKNYPKKIRKLISTTRAKYIKDNTLLKLVTYFYMRTDDKSFEQKFLNLIAELIIESKGLPKSRKGKIINDYKQKKLISESSESRDQMILEM